MKTFHVFLICTIIVAAIEVSNANILPPENLKQGNDASSEKKVTCVCPTDLHLYTEEPVLGYMKRRFVKSLLNDSGIKFEGDQVPLKDVILTMVESDIPLWQHVAFVNNIWLANYLYSVEHHPSLGSFAQIVNASVAWETSKDQKAISEALDEMAYLLHNYVAVAGDGAVKAAGCTVESPTKFREHPSDGNELLYNIDKAWEVGGGMTPSAYEKATKALYSSPSYKDKLMAIMATISITKISQDFARNFKKELVSEFLQRVHTTPIPKCCCPNFVEKMKDSAKRFGEEAINVTHGIKNDLFKKK